MTSTAEKPIKTAAINLGTYFAIASEDGHGISLILDFLEKCIDLPSEDFTHCEIIRGWLATVGGGEPKSKTELWIDFGTAIAETLAIDDGSFYDRSNYEKGEIEAEARLAIRFIAVVPAAYKAPFILGLGMGGFKTNNKNATNNNTGKIIQAV